MITKNYFRLSSLLIIALAVMSCQKMKRPALGDYPEDVTVTPTTPLRFYTNFDSTAEADKQINIRFKDSISSYPSFFPDNAIKAIPGIRGTAVMGASGKSLLYLNANDFAKSTSFTVAFWEKNTVPASEPQFLFSLVDKDFWHNSGMFAFFEHAGAGSTADSAVVKFAIEDHWFEFVPSNGKMPGKLLDGNWHHMAFVYDETTSKMSYYVDGQPLTGLPAALTNFMDGATPHGPIKLNPASVSNFVLGGWNKNANVTGPTDAWIQSWQGGLDQFRLYNKALSATEVLALFNSKL